MYFYLSNNFERMWVENLIITKQKRAQLSSTYLEKHFIENHKQHIFSQKFMSLTIKCKSSDMSNFRTQCPI